MAQNMKKKLATTCFIHKTQFSDDATELRLRIYKNMTSTNYPGNKKNYILWISWLLTQLISKHG